MPSTRVAVALAVLVVLSGCSMLPGVGGGGDDPAADRPAYHEFTFAGDTSGTEYEATVTISKDGETLHEATVESDGGGTFENLTTLDESGPYTLTVNTTIPASGGGTKSKRVRVDGDLGNQTVVDLTYHGVDVETATLPREEMETPLYMQTLSDDSAPKTVIVEYRGEHVFSTTTDSEADGPIEIGDLERTGVYHVSLGNEDGQWSNQTVLVTHPEQKVIAEFRGSERTVGVYPPDMPLPNE